jgi:hypothetical protein
MPAVGAVVLIAVAGYFLFLAVNTMGLPTQTAPATVVSKEYREPGRTYATQPVGKQNLTRVQSTPETYLLTLDIDGRMAVSAVDRRTYEALKPGDRVQATYQRRRISGALQVVGVRQ